jgi:hypothetical protein
MPGDGFRLDDDTFSHDPSGGGGDQEDVLFNQVDFTDAADVLQEEPSSSGRPVGATRFARTYLSALVTSDSDSGDRCDLKGVCLDRKKRGKQAAACRSTYSRFRDL